MGLQKILDKTLAEAGMLRLSILLILLPLISSAQYSDIKTIYKHNVYLSDIQSGFLKLNNFAFVDAQVHSNRVSQTHPHSSWPHLLQANIYWWQMVSGEDSRELREAFLKELTSAKNKVTDSHEGAFCLIMSDTYRTRLELLNGNNIAAVRHLQSYYKNLKKSLGNEAEYEAFYITSGLYYYLAAVAWAEYSFLRPFLLFLDKGDKEKGISFLENAAASSDKVISTEAIYFLMRINYDIEKKPDSAAKYSEILITRHPGNFIFLYYHMLTNEDKGLNNDKQEMIAHVLRNAQLSDKQKQYLYSLFQ